MGLERAYPTKAEFRDHIRRDWRSAHSIRKGIYDYVELDYSNIVGLTAKSIPYAGADGKLTEDNAALSWDYSTDTLKVGTISISAGWGVFPSGIRQAVTGYPSGYIWAISGSYDDYGLYYAQGTPDCMEWHWHGVTQAKIDMETGDFYLNNLIIADAGNIGSASNLDAIAIAAGGEVTLSQTLILSDVVNAGADDDKILVLDSSDNVDYRTGAEILSDIDAQASDAGLTSLAGLTYVADSMIKVTATDTYAIRTMAEVRTDLGLVIGTDVLAQQAIGIADDNLVEIDDAGAVDDEYCRFTANGIEGRTNADVLSDIGAAAASHAMSTHSDEDTYNISTSGTLDAGNATLGTIGCGTITIADGSSINLQEDITFTGATTENQIKFPDNLADALSFKEGANFYQTFITTNGSEAIQFHKKVGIGTAPYSNSIVHIREGSSGAATAQSGTNLIIESDEITNYLSFLSPNTGYQGILFGDPQDRDVGYILYYHGDNSFLIRAGAALAVTIDNAGAMAVTGCVSDGTCEIMKNENALRVIDDILNFGSGKKDKYNHERMDMKRIYNKYPFLIHEAIDVETGKKEYYDKLGAKGDLGYAAVLELNEKIILLENRITELGG